MTSEGIARAVVTAEEIGVSLDLHVEAILRDLNDANMSEIDRIDAVNEHLQGLYMARLKVRTIVHALAGTNPIP